MFSQSVSEILKNKELEEPKKKTREEWRKDKELEEARKAGTAPAAVDETGKDINPHIPQYISTAPWYYGTKGPTLKHQRIQPESIKPTASLDQYYVRELRAPTATKYRDGACKNCGAMGHKVKDCFERPRKTGAKYTNTDIAPDEKSLPKLELDFDGKRDRWNGYNPADYQEIVDRYSKIEEAKRVLKEQKLAQAGTSSTNDDEEDDDDEEKYADNADMPGTKVDSKQRITVRNLRIREDVAKYLLNLDLNSAYYDPKTRSMRDDPFSNSMKKPEDLLFGGDSFVRYTGDTKKHVNAQLFAWQAYENGVDLHLQAEPTKAELLHQEFSTKKEKYKESIKDSVLAKYGGEEHLESLPKQLIFSQSEEYVEFNRQGEIKSGQVKAAIKSKYEEDVYVNNHTAVWGSYWKDGHWGYKCCHSFIYNSYCTGVSGKEAEVIPIVQENEDPEKDEEPKTLVEIHKELKAKKANKKKKDKKKQQQQKKKKSKSSSSSSSSSSESSDDEEEKKAARLKKALEQEEENQKAGERLAKLCDRKRPYNSMHEVKAPTEEEMEAYRMKRLRSDDPMANFMN